ncbi:MAG TPA: N-6 DNA methylase, partial [Candidatus Syntrophosphaera sp.]|nr:N-6 DNA methylase [Candidatus Syntrophosphaera sp.]
MLDQETKKRIDNACNILVGKVPTPLAQVEQITLALIYKFMNDMDRRAEAMGGKASYFVGNQEKYSWDNLMDTRLGGRERADLYEEGLAGLSLNASLPDLFRNIFKEASVPYKDPRTLNLFLQEINGFSYEDSENLGDAYEYLLGKTGSQGEAGQFRTPRHIIDFIVQVVDPGKHDTILDPACGTAGFLISAIKHIYKTNTREIEGDMLSTREIMGLSNNVFGYDITPDMVRISRVNMFLHNINQPHIYEYDTLSSLEKWDDNFSCILANPPFMTPKGGVVPHNRFSIKSSRSEVLFVDYMLEHLTVDGKAGIIVPEGIIFKSDKACKQLRKKLVEENYLAGVISLPAGVFNPYSGVKTSILWIDRTLAKKANKIIFLKIDADGFDLGANRRPIEANDLPAAIASAKAYKSAILSGSEYQAPAKDVILVEKAKLAERGEYNLSGERYGKKENKRTSIYDLISLGEICDLYQPQTISGKDLQEDGEYPVFGANGVIGKYHSYNHSESEVVITCRGATCGTINVTQPKSWITGNAMVAHPKTNQLDQRYLFYCLKYSDLSSTVSGSAQPQITRTSLAPYKIPLPPLSVQEEIVAELDSYQKIIDGARQVVDN